MNITHAATDTIAKIRSTKVIVLGVRDAARPFSFLNEQKQSVGYSVDIGEVVFVWRLAYSCTCNVDFSRAGET